mgnify:CR=1 FL=1
MTRTAPLITLLAVGVLGGALFVVNTVSAQESAAAPQNAAVSAAAPAAPAEAPAPAAEDAGQVDLGEVPVAGADPAAGAGEVDLAEVPVAPAQDDPAQDDAEPAPLADGVYAGRTTDRSMTVAIAIKDGEAEAYVCDGERVEFWLSGTATEDGLDLATRDGEVTMTGTLDDDTFSGTVTADSDEWDYTAAETTVEDAAADGRTDVGRVADRVGL